MNRIVMNEPVWNGGNSYFSIRTDRVTSENVYILCDYKDKYGNKKYPNPMYGNGSLIKKSKVYKERWGNAYRVHIKDLEDVIYNATISWGGYSEDGNLFNEDAEYSFNRSSYDDLLDGIKEYLDKYKSRKAKFECASMETTKSLTIDLTKTINNKLRS